MKANAMSVAVTEAGMLLAASFNGAEFRSLPLFR